MRGIVIPATYSWTDNKLQLTGQKQVKWTSYGVPDPSIIISKLHPEIDVRFDLELHESL